MVYSPDCRSNDPYRCIGPGMMLRIELALRLHMMLRTMVHQIVLQCYISYRRNLRNLKYVIIGHYLTLYDIIVCFLCQVAAFVYLCGLFLIFLNFLGKS